MGSWNKQINNMLLKKNLNSDLKPNNTSASSKRLGSVNALLQCHTRSLKYLLYVDLFLKEGDRAKQSAEFVRLNRTVCFSLLCFCASEPKNDLI